MLSGDLYIADDPDLISASQQAAELAHRYNNALDPSERQELLSQLLAGVGEETVIRSPLFVDYGSNLTVGARTFANFGLVALDVAPISIGDDVQIGPNVQLLTATHPVDKDLRRDKWESADPIVIGNNVWLGGGVIVLGGVSIGDNTVVGAGSVVSRDLPADVVAVGTPARAVRSVDHPADP